MDFVLLFKQLLDLAEKYGPTITALVMWYLHNQRVQKKNQERVKALEAQLEQNKKDVEAENAGLSSGAIIDKYTGGGTGPGS